MNYAGKDSNKSDWTLNKEYVFIVDSHGIQDAFFKIKTKLNNEPGSHFSVLHISNDLISSSLFKNELKYLEKRFQSRLSVFFIKTSKELMFDSERIEVIINCSMVESQQFIIVGKQDFVDKAESQLLFLSINKNKITTEIIKN